MEKDNVLAEWGMVDEETTTTLEQMDDMIRAYRSARDAYDKAKDFASQCGKVADEIETKIIGMLQANKRSKYEVEGIASVSITHRESFTTPKSSEAKQQLFDYIKGKYGDESLLGLLSINSRTLNSWAKQESESGVMAIPGLEAPTSEDILSMRRKD